MHRMTAEGDFSPVIYDELAVKWISLEGEENEIWIAI